MAVEMSGIEPIIAKLQETGKRTGNLRPALLEVGSVLKNEVMDSFDRGSSPFGRVWAPLKKPRKSGGSKVLVDSGQLATAWSVSADANSVSVGTNLIYARVHQYGSKKPKGRGGGIPARPYLPVDSSGNFKKETVIKCVEKLEEYITEVLG